MIKLVSSYCKKLCKKIRWHRYPTPADLSLKSIVEFLFYILVAGISIYFFYKWHIVPERRIVIIVDKIQGEKTFKFDTIHTEEAFVNVIIPMTKRESVNGDGYTISMESKEQFIPNYDHKPTSSYYLSPVFTDSITKQLYKDVELNNKTKDSLLNVFRFNANLNNKKVVYFAFAFNRGPNSGYSPKTSNFDKMTCNNDTLFLYSQFDTPASKSLHKLLIANNTLNIKKELGFHGDVLSSPKWYRFEDISQSYFDVRFNSSSFDSLSLKIDFVGVTDFSNIIPQPDEIGMSSIYYKDYEKIKRIKEKGIQFHAEFKELKNLQTVRLLGITTILGGVIIIFIGMLFIGLYHFVKWGRNSKFGCILFVIIVCLVVFYAFGILNSIYCYFKYY